MVEMIPSQPLRPRSEIRQSYVGSTMDLFHAGHVFLLQQAARLAKHVVVVLNTDEFVERFKGKKPAMSLAERMIVVGACRFVDDVDINVSGEDSKPMIEKHQPDYIVFGDDYTVERYCKQMQFDLDWLNERNIQLVRVPRKNGWSSTSIRETIKSR